MFGKSEVPGADLVGPEVSASLIYELLSDSSGIGRVLAGRGASCLESGQQKGPSKLVSSL